MYVIVHVCMLSTGVVLHSISKNVSEHKEKNGYQFSFHCTVKLSATKMFSNFEDLYKTRGKELTVVRVCCRKKIRVKSRER